MSAVPASLVLVLLHGACALPAAQPADCAALPAGRERDVCWQAEIGAVPPEAADTVPALVAEIEDPVVRDAAVLTWLDDNRDRVSPRQGEALCRLLHATRAQSCLRRLQAAHLQP